MKNGPENIDKLAELVYNSDREENIKSELLSTLANFVSLRDKETALLLLNKWRTIMITTPLMEEVKAEGEAKGIRIGEAKGIQIGETKGDKNRQIETARRMKEKNYPPEEIADITGLSIDEIGKL